MNQPLSPAANAVWEAFNESLEQVGWFSDYGDALGAALRAAAEHLTSEEEPLFLALADRMRLDARNQFYAKLRAIAAELEGQAMTRKRSTQRGIACPECGSDRSEVNESRHSPGDNTIRRRRICHGCLARYTTYETLTRPAVINQMADHATSHLVGRDALDPFLRDLQKLIDNHRA